MGDPVDCCVPCGNFGNILAAVYAKAMGVPYRNFTVAANKNNVLSDFLQTGKYEIKERSLSKTISPSIDILTSSNLERMLHLLCVKAGDQDAGVEVGPTAPPPTAPPPSHDYHCLYAAAAPPASDRRFCRRDVRSAAASSR